MFPLQEDPRCTVFHLESSTVCKEPCGPCMQWSAQTPTVSIVDGVLIGSSGLPWWRRMVPVLVYYWTATVRHYETIRVKPMTVKISFSSTTIAVVHYPSPHPRRHRCGPNEMITALFFGRRQRRSRRSVVRDTKRKPTTHKKPDRHTHTHTHIIYNL